MPALLHACTPACRTPKDLQTRERCGPTRLQTHKPTRRTLHAEVQTNTRSRFCRSELRPVCLPGVTSAVPASCSPPWRCSVAPSSACASSEARRRERSAARAERERSRSWCSVAEGSVGGFCRRGGGCGKGSGRRRERPAGESAGAALLVLGRKASVVLFSFKELVPSGGIITVAPWDDRA